MSTLLWLSGYAELAVPSDSVANNSNNVTNHNPNPDNLYPCTFYSCCLDKILGKCHLKEKGLLEAPRSRVKFSMTEASEKQKFEGTGHIPSTVRKTNDKCSLQLQFLTAPGSPGSQAEGDIMRLVGPLTSTDAYKTISLAQLAQRSTSWIILDFAKLTINSNHHNNPIVTTFAFFFLH